MTNKYVPDNFIFPLRWASASVYEIPTVIAKTKATIDLYLFSYHWLLSAAERFHYYCLGVLGFIWILRTTVRLKTTRPERKWPDNII